MAKHPHKKISKSLLIGGGIFLILVLVVSAFFLFRTIDRIRHGGIKHPPRNPLGMFLSGERPMSATGAIEGWMTFDFVNKLYHLPPNYLKEMMRIEDSRYPDIPIGRYAKSIGFSKEDSIAMVERAIALYENTPPQK